MVALHWCNCPSSSCICLFILNFFLSLSNLGHSISRCFMLIGDRQVSHRSKFIFSRCWCVIFVWPMGNLVIITWSLLVSFKAGLISCTPGLILWRWITFVGSDHCLFHREYILMLTILRKSSFVRLCCRLSSVRLHADFACWIVGFKHSESMRE